MNRLKNRLWVVVAALALTALSVNSGHAEEREAPRLAFELSSLREAWLYGDDDTAAARLDTLRRDNRISGEFPRWYATLRSVLALKQNDSKTALETLQPVLEASQDARNYVRSARVLLAYGHPELAQQVIDAGLVRAPDSPALLRHRAGLQWLQGDFDGALETYLGMICNDERPQYPYITPAGGRWSSVKPWNATSDKPAVDAQPVDDEDYYYYEDQPETEYQPEPFTSLFLQFNWFPCDLPGLDRCLAAIAADPEQLAARTANLDALVKTARDSQDELDALRMGDDETRKQFEQKARKNRWHAVLALRLVITAQLANDEIEQAEKNARLGLEIAPDDIALLDLLAQAYGRLGKPEEARSVPLARLRTLAYLGVYSNTLYAKPNAQIVDRVFAPALTLYRANPEAGLAQFEQMRTSFGDANRNQPVYAGLLGLWLFLQNEPELARKNLLEASRLSGYESGKPIYGESVVVEMALLALGEGNSADEGETPIEDAEKVEVPEGEDPVEVARLDANANPLLRKSLRAGAVIGSVYDVRTRIRGLLGVDVYASSSGVMGVRAGAEFLPEGDAVMQETLWDLPAKLAEEVTEQELEAFLAPEHTTSTSLKNALDTMAELVTAASGNNSWRTRQSLGQKAGPVLGMLEARTLLLRARLRQLKPQSLADLKTWLDKNQSQIDIRSQLKAPASDEYSRFKQARADAGIPEIVHTGLALDAACILARAGKTNEAARLLWFNRDALLGIESQGHMLSLASVFARKADNGTLAIRCRLEAANSAPDMRNTNTLDPQIALVELSATRRDLLEFGDKMDLLTYLENMLIPYADSPMMLRIARIAPELQDARASLTMRNTSRAGTSGIFASSVANGNCGVIFTNWVKMIATPETFPGCQRFAAWVIASDLPVRSGSGSYTGLTTTQEMLLGFSMLYELDKRMSANDPVALAAADRLNKLLVKLAGAADGSDAAGDSWWG